MSGKMPMPFIVTFSIITAIFFGYLSQTTYSAESGCIKCHTNEQVLKSLHKPQKIETSEGEG